LLPNHLRVFVADVVFAPSKAEYLGAVTNVSRVNAAYLFDTCLPLIPGGPIECPIFAPYISPVLVNGTITGFSVSIFATQTLNANLISMRDLVENSQVAIIERQSGHVIACKSSHCWLTVKHLITTTNYIAH
jgi:hypothetical protein